jgi:hypothetical protein
MELLPNVDLGCKCSAQIRIMTGRPPTSRNMLATTFRKLSDTVRSQ